MKTIGGGVGIRTQGPSFPGQLISSELLSTNSATPPNQLNKNLLILLECLGLCDPMSLKYLWIPALE